MFINLNKIENHRVDKTKKLFFFYSSDMFKVKNFDGVLDEINILLRLHNGDNDSNNTLKSIIESSNKMKTIMPLANALYAAKH